MKKILLVLSILALVSFTGCNVKNVENQGQNNVVANPNNVIENQDNGIINPDNVQENQEGVTEGENTEKIEKLTNLNKEKMTA